MTKIMPVSGVEKTLTSMKKNSEKGLLLHASLEDGSSMKGFLSNLSFSDEGQILGDFDCLKSGDCYEVEGKVIRSNTGSVIGFNLNLPNFTSVSYLDSNCDQSANVLVERTGQYYPKRGAGEIFF